MRVSIGCDPEFFLERNGVPVPAVGFVPGTKAEPHPFPKGAVQLDGTAIEFNIKPAYTQLGFVTNIKSTMKRIRRMVPEDMMFKFSPTVTYDKRTFDALPEEAKELGCDPDFNAWKDGKENPRPDNATTMRSGAGHIHIGWGKNFDIKSPDHIWDCCYITKALDNWFYPYSQVWDGDAKRQKLYGKPGAFRPKPYGLEYRVMSNAWLNYPLLWPWIHESCTTLMKHVEAGTKLPTSIETYKMDIADYTYFKSDPWSKDKAFTYLTNFLKRKFPTDMPYLDEKLLVKE